VSARAEGYFAGITRDTVLLALASLFADISSEMLYPVLPIFLTQVLKANGSVVGLVEGVAEATQNIVQGFSGSLSDKLQRRNPIALIGYALAMTAGGQRALRHRQLQQRLPDSSDQGDRRLPGGGHPHLCRVQSGRRSDFLPSWRAIRPAWPPEPAARFVRHLPGGLSRLRACAKRGPDRRALRPLRPLSGNLPIGGEGSGERPCDR
jgi:hypothetical protein